jgi:hypothetical protein
MVHAMTDVGMIVSLHDGAELAEVRRGLEAHGFKVTAELPILGALRGRAEPGSEQLLSSVPGVRAVRQERETGLASPGEPH